MGDQYIGEIRLVPFDFAPYGWALCNGAVMTIQSNNALFALLGTRYGGDGVSTFGLPNLQSRVVVGMGQGAGLSPYTIGQVSGTESTQLQISNMPAHAHNVALSVNSTVGDTNNPSDAYLGLATDSNQLGSPIYTQKPGTATMAPQATSSAGQGLSFSNLQPYLVLNYIIALQGVYPTRS